MSADPTTLLHVLRDRAATTPDRVVYTHLLDGERQTTEVTFAELWRQTRTIARALVDAGLRGERVMLLFPPGLDYAPALLGCFLAGAIAVPEGPPDPRRPERSLPRIRAVAANARVAAVLTVEGLMAVRSSMPSNVMGVPWLAVDDMMIGAVAGDAGHDASLPAAGELAYLQYTSGSTSDPKGVMLSHGNLAANCRAIEHTYRPPAHSVMVSWVPTFHDLGLVYSIAMPVWGGFHGVSLAAADFARRPVRWLEAIDRFRGTHTIAPDIAYAITALKTRPEDRADLDLSCWQMALNGAEPVRRSTEQAFVDAFAATGFRPEVFSHSWGLSEATAKVTGEQAGARMEFLRVDADALAEHRVVRAGQGTARVIELASCGTAATGTDLLIVDPSTLEPASPDVVGEVWVRGPSIGRGYWDADEATAETFGARTAGGDGPWLRTGDRGFMDDGRLFIAGRIKEILIIRGHNHYPQDLEASIAGTHRAIRPGGTVAFSVDGPQGEQVCIVAEVRPDRIDDPEAIYGAMRAALGEHGLRPAHIALVKPGAVPRTTSGKLQRRKTRALLLDDALDALYRWSAPDAAPAAPGESAPTPTGVDRRAALATLRAAIASVLGVAPDTIDARRPVAELGLDSAMLAELAGRLEAAFGRPFPATLLYDRPTPDALAGWIVGDDAPRIPSAPPAPVANDQAIVIVSMACRLPGADSPAALWALLDAGRDAIGDFPTDRGWDVAGLYDPDPEAVGRTYAPGGGFVDGVADFDPQHFGITPREARAMDPQQRMLLELTWEAFERGGLDPSAMVDREVGVFVGLCQTDYAALTEAADTATDGLAVLGRTASVASGRIAYVFGLRGPAVTLDTACSSSLVAVHQAAQALRAGDCELALAGGATVHATPEAFVAFSRMRALSPTGRSRAFSVDADGAGWAEGGALLMMARADYARAHGLPMLAVVKGSAINQDGRSQGLTAPHGPSQARVIRKALAAAGLSPPDVDLVEAHGTGTRLGDPIEAGALLETYGQRPPDAPPVRLGSIKSNLGHTQAAAGAAGIIKVVEALRAERVPATLHAPAPSPFVDWSRGRVELAMRSSAWPRGARVRRAGVSSFGISGTNAHVIIEETPTVAMAEADMPAGLPLVVSGRDAGGLQAQAARWLEWLVERPDVGPIAVRRAAARRAHLDARAAVFGPAREGLRALAAGEAHADVIRGRATATDGVVFVFPGQGSQWAGMGRDLYGACPAFAERVDACDAAIAALTGWSVRDVLCGAPDAPSLDRVEVVQPALFAMAVGLAASWAARGVRPTAVIGHSQGEIAAAVVSGALSVADGARVVVERSALLTAVAGQGGMAVVPLAVDAVDALLSDAELALSVAVVNTADSTVVSGTTAALDAFDARLAERGLSSRRVAVDYASHGPAMDAILPALTAKLSGLRPGAGAVPMISTVTGQSIDGAALVGDYWCRNLREPVRLDRALQHVGEPMFVEISAHPILAMPLTSAAGRAERVVGSLRRDEGGADRLARSLAELHVAGGMIDWADAVGPGPLAELPTHAFQRQRLWIDRSTVRPTAPAPVETQGKPMPGPRRQDVLPAVITAVTEVTGLDASAVAPDAGLVGLGVDSLMFMQIKNTVRQRYAVEVPNGLFFEAGMSARTVADFVTSQLPDAPAAAPVASSPTLPVVAAPSGAVDGVAALMAEQMRAMAELARQQLETLQRLGGAPSASAPSGAVPAVTPRAVTAPAPAAAPPSPSSAPVFRPYRPIQKEGGRAGDYMADMVSAYTGSTPTSKARTQADRFVFANNRNIAGFTPATKEMTYQIIAERAQGGHVWDLDGHRYVDLTQGFGSSLLGHGHPLLTEAIRRQLDETWAVGPISNDASTVARHICAMTGAERVAFYNSGTEAVMVSIRLARTATGRPKVVFFEGAYHGMFDGLMAIPRRGAAPGTAAPMAPGVPDSMVADTLVLPYDDPESLRIIEEHGHEIAGVLVESVQSRRPDRQPRTFLHRLRALTEQIGAALIFDEVVTGFRTAPGGAQAWFGVNADLAAYGKVAGGAMPVGIVAGRAAFLDGVDGGMWRFGDDSMPEKTNTFVAGTFCSHPLTMASARAMLEHLAEQGPALQRDLNGRTRRLCTRLNQVFAEAGLPIHTVPFGSLFRYVVPRGYELLYNRLLIEKVYVWEGRNCFLATAHDAEDIEHIVAATRASAAWLAQHAAADAPPTAGGYGVEHRTPSAAQRIMYRRSRRPGSDRAYHVPAALVVDGALDVDRFEPALTELTGRHEALRTSFHHDGEALWQRIHPFGDFDLRIEVDAIGEDAIDDFVDGMIRPFDVSTPALLRVGVARLGPDRHLVVLDAHHLVVDGLSMKLLIDELLALVQNRVLAETPIQYRRYVDWQRDYLESAELKRDEAAWRALLADLPPRVELPRSVDNVATLHSFRCGRVWLDLHEPLALRALARAEGVTLNVLLHALFQVWLGAVSGRDDVFYGSPTAARPEGFEATLGLFIGVVVYRARLDDDLRFTDLLAQTREATGRLMRLQNVPFERVQPLMADAGDGSTPFEVGFNYETDMGPFSAGDLAVTPRTTPMPGMSLGCVVEVHDHGDVLRLCIAHDPERYRFDHVEAWARLFDGLARRVVDAPQSTIDAIRAELLGEDGPLTELA